MLIVVDTHSGVPVYRQVIEQVRFHVDSGILAPGDELPSTRALSAELGVNPMTISKAFRRLEEDGVLERRPGRPLVVRERDEDDPSAGLERLREDLAPIVTKARQLGLDPRDVAALFRSMLEDQSPGDTGGGGES